MDYISQIEKLFSYLKLNYSFEKSYKFEILRRKFNQDLNLFGCFLKDFLILETQKYDILDEKLYETFVLYFENNVNIDEKNKEDFLQKIIKYGEYYLMIVFEDINQVEIKSAITTINLCYNLEVYPLIMQILYKYFNNLIDNRHAIRMIQSLVNIVLANFENLEKNNIDIRNISIGEKDLIIKFNEKENIAV